MNQVQLGFLEGLKKHIGSITPFFSDSKSFCGNDVLSTTGDLEGYHASLKGNSVVLWNKRFTIGRNKADVH